MKKEIALKSAYSVLRRKTPLKFDCGSLCGGSCCKGDEETGMLLFPGEELLIDENIKILESDNGLKLAVCEGSCNRNKRPLACRIYPLFPLVTEENGKYKIKVVYDFRAACPIGEDKLKIQKSFKRGVKRVGEYLLSNEETKEYLKMLSAQFDEFYALRESLLK